MTSLQGKTAVITGATGGIGEATVRQFLEAGANVIAVGRSADKLDTLSKNVNQPDRLAVAVAEATDEAATQAAVNKAREQFGGIDILFANAGTEGHSKPFETMSAEEFRAPYETNVVGVWMAMKAVAGHMREQGSGSIIVTASIAGLIGFPGLANYAASKHAVIGLVKTGALELAEQGVRVNAIAPGPVDNRMIHAIEDQLAPDDPRALEAHLKQLIPMKRYAVNEEVARLALFLASDDSSYCSGSVFTLDGGFTAA